MRNRNHMLNFFALMLLALSQEMVGQDIRYAAEHTNVDIGVRAIAMGGTGVSLTGGGITSYWNPSLISLDPHYKVFVEGSRLYGGLSNIGSANAVVPINKGPHLGLLYDAFFSGDITQWDSLPGTATDRLYNPELRPTAQSGRGVFHNNSHIAAVTAAKSFSLSLPRPQGFSVPFPVDVAGGINFKYHWQTLTPDDDVRIGMNVNVDVGVSARIGVDFDLQSQTVSREIVIGLAVKNALPTKETWLGSYEDYGETVDASYYYGMSYADRSGFLFADWTVAVSLERAYKTSAHIGLEALFWDHVAFRAGVDNRIPTVGAGVQFKLGPLDMIAIDYALVFNELAITPLCLSVGSAF